MNCNSRRRSKKCRAAGWTGSAERTCPSLRLSAGGGPKYLRGNWSVWRRRRMTQRCFQSAGVSRATTALKPRRADVGRRWPGGSGKGSSSAAVNAAKWLNGLSEVFAFQTGSLMALYGASKGSSADKIFFWRQKSPKSGRISAITRMLRRNWSSLKQTEVLSVDRALLL